MKKMSVLCLVVLFAIAGCDSDNPAAPVGMTPPPTTTTTTAPPANANVQISGEYVCTDPFCDGADFFLVLRNTGGVGANLNFIRVENRQRAPVAELGADHFINAFGHNRLEAGESLDVFLHAQLGFVIVVGYRGDNGVGGEAEWFPDLPR